MYSFWNQYITRAAKISLLESRISEPEEINEFLNPGNPRKRKKHMAIRPNH